jgi:hypothetical protein
MASRCAFKDGSRRCSRNGFGNPALCRAHAIQVKLDGEPIDLQPDSPLMSILELADRAFSKSNNEFARQVGSLFGEFLSNNANSSNARRVPPRNEYRAPPPAPAAAKDPREVLGFEPGEQLTRARVKARQRDLATVFHPDKPAGSAGAMARVNEAAQELLKSL